MSVTTMNQGPVPYNFDQQPEQPQQQSPAQPKVHLCLDHYAKEMNERIKLLDSGDLDDRSREILINDLFACVLIYCRALHYHKAKERKFSTRSNENEKMATAKEMGAVYKRYTPIAIGILQIAAAAFPGISDAGRQATSAALHAVHDIEGKRAEAGLTHLNAHSSLLQHRLETQRESGNKDDEIANMQKEFDRQRHEIMSAIHNM